MHGIRQKSKEIFEFFPVPATNGHFQMPKKLTRLGSLTTKCTYCDDEGVSRIDFKLI